MLQTYQASWLTIEPKHHAECWYEPDDVGWRCVAICPVRMAQARLL